MQRHSADKLNVEGDHFPKNRVAANGDFRFAVVQAPARVLNDGERFRQDFVQPFREFILVLNFGKIRLPIGGLLAQVVIGERLKTSLDFVDFGDQRAQSFDFAVVFLPDDFF
jgi:hypothetical protein